MVETREKKSSMVSQKYKSWPGGGSDHGVVCTRALELSYALYNSCVNNITEAT